MNNKQILSEYDKNKKICQNNWIWFERHDLSKLEKRIRFDIYTDKDYRSIRKIFPHYQLDKAKSKTIGWQNQYLISYDI